MSRRERFAAASLRLEFNNTDKRTYTNIDMSNGHMDIARSEVAPSASSFPPPAHD